MVARVPSQRPGLPFGGEPVALTEQVVVVAVDRAHDRAGQHRHPAVAGTASRLRTARQRIGVMMEIPTIHLFMPGESTSHWMRVRRAGFSVSMAGHGKLASNWRPTAVEQVGLTASNLLETLALERYESG